MEKITNYKTAPRCGKTRTHADHSDATGKLELVMNDLAVIQAALDRVSNDYQSDRTIAGLALLMVRVVEEVAELTSSLGHNLH